MPFTQTEQMNILDKQVRDWTAELNRIASQIAAAKGKSCALVLITPRGEGYEDVLPEYIVEDALNVMNGGWPTGFDVDILNRSPD